MSQKSAAPSSKPPAEQVVRRLDHGEVDAQRTDAQAAVGLVHCVYCHGGGVGGERLAAQPGALGGIGLPGRAIGAAGPLPARAAGIDRSAGVKPIAQDRSR